MSPKTAQPNQSIASTSISDVIQGRLRHRPADFAVVTTLTKSYVNPSLSGVNHVTAASPILKWAQSLVCSGRSRRLESIRCQLLVHTPNGRRMVRVVVGMRTVVDIQADPVGLLRQLDRAGAGADMRTLRTDGPWSRLEVAPPRGPAR